MASPHKVSTSAIANVCSCVVIVVLVLSSISIWRAHQETLPIKEMSDMTAYYRAAVHKDYAIRQFSINDRRIMVQLDNKELCGARALSIKSKVDVDLSVFIRFYDTGQASVVPRETMLHSRKLTPQNAVGEFKNAVNDFIEYCQSARLLKKQWAAHIEQRNGGPHNR